MIKGSIGKMTSSLICILGQNSLMKLKSETTTTKASLLGMIEFWNQCKHYQMKPTWSSREDSMMRIPWCPRCIPRWIELVAVRFPREWFQRFRIFCVRYLRGIETLSPVCHRIIRGTIMKPLKNWNYTKGPWACSSSKRHGGPESLHGDMSYWHPTANSWILDRTNPFKSEPGETRIDPQYFFGHDPVSPVSLPHPRILSADWPTYRSICRTNYNQWRLDQSLQHRWHLMARARKSSTSRTCSTRWLKCNLQWHSKWNKIISTHCWDKGHWRHSRT